MSINFIVETKSDPFQHISELLGVSLGFLTVSVSLSGKSDFSVIE